MAQNDNRHTDGFSVQKAGLKRKTAANTSSSGTAADLFDWKTGEHKTFISQGELKFYYILRWNDDVLDIQSQYPLDNAVVDFVIKKLSDDENGETEITEIMKLDETDLVEDNREPYSTDLFVTLKDGSHKAFQVKADPNSIRSPKVARRLLIEQAYFAHIKIPWQLIYTSEINLDYYLNIKRAVEYYDPKKCHDDQTKFLCLVAHKHVLLDMKSGPIDWKAETEKYLATHNGKISLKGITADV